MPKYQVAAIDRPANWTPECDDDVPLKLKGPVEVLAEFDQPPAPAPKPQPIPTLRVLAVDDNPVNLKVISAMLKWKGHEVTAANSGAQALELVRQQPFDLILMDGQMPVMDGLKATQVLRTKGYSGLIIALTAHAMTDDKARCIEAGCDDYATKPVKIAALCEVIRRNLAQGRCLAKASPNA